MRRPYRPRYEVGDIIEQWYHERDNTHLVKNYIILQIEPEHVIRKGRPSRYYWLYTAKNLLTGKLSWFGSSYIDRPWLWDWYSGTRKVA
jgi:hypothetical protein